MAHSRENGSELPSGYLDRGILVEAAWPINAGEVIGQPKRDLLWLSDLKAPILNGDLPAVIFNGTVMELGRRVMMTPIEFSATDSNAAMQRAPTLSELYQVPSGQSANLTVWTAARMSATFPYVTPAARAKFLEPGPNADCEDIQGSEQKPLCQKRRALHLIDGGYYDNYGVASALDWLDPVLNARLNNELDFQRVLIINTVDRI